MTVSDPDICSPEAFPHYQVMALVATDGERRPLEPQQQLGRARGVERAVEHVSQVQETGGVMAAGVGQHRLERPPVAVDVGDDGVDRPLIGLATAWSGVMPRMISLHATRQVWRSWAVAPMLESRIFPASRTSL